MYRKVPSRNKERKTINIGVIFMVVLLGVFACRVINILNTSNERGGLAYVQLLNFGMPIVESEVYNEGDYAENRQSIKTVCIQALGLQKINSFQILSEEVSFFHQGLDINNSSNTVASATLTPFSINDTSIIKVDNVEDNSLKKKIDQTKPEVLIYHTHTSEGYAEGSPDTDNADLNVVGVGDELTKELENNYGISVIHDKTNHSISYIGCYERSNGTVKKYLDQYGDFKLIIDLHRDSIDNKDAVTLNINNENVAKIMLVNAMNSTRYAKNKELSDFFYNKTNELFPGLIRNTYTYKSGIYAFNQSLSDNSVLIEWGSVINSSEESKNTAKYVARIIAEYLKK